MENLRIIGIFVLYGSLIGAVMSGIGYVINKFFDKGRYIPNILSIAVLIYYFIMARLDTTGWVGLGAVILMMFIIVGNIVSIGINILLNRL
jgi:fatty-acid desaturase